MTLIGNLPFGSPEMIEAIWNENEDIEADKLNIFKIDAYGFATCIIYICI